MGTIPIDRKVVRTKESEILFDIWSTTSDLSCEEFGYIFADITVRNLSPVGEQVYRLTVCAADYTERWARRFIDAFSQTPEFRNQFLVKDEKGKASDELPIDLGRGLVGIDRKIVDAIVKFNSLGIITQNCCSGITKADSTETHSETAYIDLQHGNRFPEDLQTAWRNAGFQCSSDHVRASALIGLEPLANARFVQSLEDWLTDGRQLEVPVNDKQNSRCNDN